MIGKLGSFLSKTKSSIYLHTIKTTKSNEKKVFGKSIIYRIISVDNMIYWIIMYVLILLRVE